MWDDFIGEWQRVKMIAKLEKEIIDADLSDDEIILLFCDIAEERGFLVNQKKSECKIKVKKK